MTDRKEPEGNEVTCPDCGGHPLVCQSCDTCLHTGVVDCGVVEARMVRAAWGDA